MSGEPITDLMPDEIALIAGPSDEKLKLYLPANRGDMQMSRMQLFLGMILVKSGDPEFVDEIIAEYTGKKSKAS